MIDTRLILIDGMTGSGKSTTAHYIARQLGRRGVKVRWFHEEEEGHPLAWTAPADLPPEADERAKKERFMREYPARWAGLARSARDFGGVYIVESYLFQYALMPLMRLEFGEAVLADFVRSLVAEVADLDPVLVHFHQRDVAAALRLNWKRRGAEWEAWYTGRMAATDYAKKRGLGGAEAAIEVCGRFTELTRSVAESLGIRLLSVENSGQDWESYRAAVMAFLGEEALPEELARPGEEDYCGDYRARVEGEELLFKVRLRGGRLRLDAFWPDLALLPKSGGEYEIEGFPFAFRFAGFGREAGEAGDSGIAQRDDQGILASGSDVAQRAIVITDAPFFLERGLRLERVG